MFPGLRLTMGAFGGGREKGAQRPTRSSTATAGWAARYLWTRRWRFARERLIETKLTAG
jgi:hypothetical protein